jgi:hypothetical protein
VGRKTVRAAALPAIGEAVHKATRDAAGVCATDADSGGRQGNECASQRYFGTSGVIGKACATVHWSADCNAAGTAFAMTLADLNSQVVIAGIQ